VSDAGLTAAPAPRGAVARAPVGPEYGPWLRLAAFMGLAGLGSAYWASFVADAPNGDVFGVLLIGTGLGAALIALGRSRLPAPAIHAGAAVAAIVALGLSLVAIGLEASLLQPARWDDFAALIDRGFDGLGTASWPYDQSDDTARRTILLAIPAVVVPAAAFAFWPVRKRPGFDSVALVLLIAFYTVAITDQDFSGELGRGIVLLALIAAWLWLPSLGRRSALAGAVTVALAGLVALPVAAALERDEPLVDYTTWSIGSDREASATFDWNHRYGSIDWPRSGRTLLAVRSDEPHYWKAESLDHFDGLRWAHRRTRASLASELPPTFERRWDERISFAVRDLRSDLLIGAGTVLDTEGDLGVTIPSGDGTVRLIDRPLAAGDSYSVRAYVPDPSAAAMRDAPDAWPEQLRRYVALSLPQDGMTAINTPPEGERDRFYTEDQIAMPFRGEPYRSYDRDTVRQIRDSPYARTYALARSLAEDQPTTYDVVRNTERWLQRELRYSERVPTRPYPLSGFLFEDKLGFCQQFSGAMALMLRMNGIPARVAAGFAPGIYDQATKEYRVRDLDAHSWVEVYFAGIGWVPFDPTPSAAPAESQSAGSDSASAARGGPDRAESAGTRQRDEATGAGPASAGGGNSGPPWWLMPVVVLGLAAAALAALWIYAVGLERRHRGAAPADAELAELRSALERMGHGVPPQTTLATLERRLGSRVGPAAARYVAIMRARRYAPTGGAPPGRADRAALRRELGAAAGRLGRVRAFFALPPRSPSW
jgi:transglutaminase-like putative cysteine protease